MWISAKALDSIQKDRQTDNQAIWNESVNESIQKITEGSTLSLNRKAYQGAGLLLSRWGRPGILSP